MHHIHHYHKPGGRLGGALRLVCQWKDQCRCCVGMFLLPSHRRWWRRQPMGHSTHGCGRGWKGCDQASGSREQPWQNQAAQTDHVHAQKQDHAYNNYRQICSNPVNRSLHTVALCVISTTSSPLQSFFLVEACLYCCTRPSRYSKARTCHSVHEWKAIWQHTRASRERQSNKWQSCFAARDWETVGGLWESTSRRSIVPPPSVSKRSKISLICAACIAYWYHYHHDDYNYEQFQTRVSCAREHQQLHRIWPCLQLRALIRLYI